MALTPPPTDAPWRGAVEGRHALVTGGAGFVGSHLVDRLVGAGATVTVVDDLSSGRADNLAEVADDARVRLVHLDVAGLGEAIISPRVDLVAHLACPASPVDYHQRPLATLHAGAFGTWATLELARHHGARFLLASTSEVYGDPLVHPQPETYAGNVDVTSTRAVYDEAKRYAETLTHTYRRVHGLTTAVARLFNTYGPRMRADDGRVVPTFLGAALRGEPLPVQGDGEQTRAFAYVDDTVDGLLRLLARPTPRPCNLGNPAELTINQLVTVLGQVVGRDLEVEHTERTANDPARRCPDIAFARRHLGWEPQVDLPTGLAATLAWLAGRSPDALVEPRPAGATDTGSPVSRPARTPR